MEKVRRKFYWKRALLRKIFYKIAFIHFLSKMQWESCRSGTDVRTDVRTYGRTDISYFGQIDKALRLRLSGKHTPNAVPTLNSCIGLPEHQSMS